MIIKPKARLLVSFDVLKRLLELPSDCDIVGAEWSQRQGDILALLWLDGDGAPDLDGGDCNAEYSTKPRFDRFRPSRKHRIYDTRTTAPRSTLTTECPSCGASVPIHADDVGMIKCHECGRELAFGARSDDGTLVLNEPGDDGRGV